MIEIPGATFLLVGGSVRDQLLGRKAKDRDYVVLTEMSFAELSDAMQRHGATIFLEKYEFLTIRARFEGEVFDVALPRVDGEYIDGRRPVGVSQVASLEQDARRRDFTINAMYLDPLGQLIDFFGGKFDLNYGLIRAVGDPEKRFAEDYLRILRAIRFAAVLGFEIVPSTMHSIVMNAQGLEKIAANRIREELNKALLADPRMTFNFLDELAIRPRGFFGLMKEKGLSFEATLRERGAP